MMNIIFFNFSTLRFSIIRGFSYFGREVSTRETNIAAAAGFHTSFRMVLECAF